MALIELPIATGDGIFLARYSETGLARLVFPNANEPTQGKLADVRRNRPNGRVNGAIPANNPKGALDRRLSPQVRHWHRVATGALKSILAGRSPKDLPPLDWTGTTRFQQSVWRQMLKLGPGMTKSYGEIAVAIGKPKAVRAVGSACGANPMPVLVPCHRILAAHKKIGGFSSGLDWKRRLLAKEGLEF